MEKYVLAWDCSSADGLVMLLKLPLENRFEILSRWSFNTQAKHAERLLWCVDKILTAFSLPLENIDAFAVGIGPGSFTGLRMAGIVARTFGQTLQKSIIPISSLAMYNRKAAWLIKQFLPDRTYTLSGRDAYQGQFFLRLENYHTNDVDEMVVDLENISSVLPVNQKGCFIGNFPMLIQTQLHHHGLIDLNLLDASIDCAFASCVYDEWVKGNFIYPLALLPNYSKSFSKKENKPI